MVAENTAQSSDTGDANILARRELCEINGKTVFGCVAAAYASVKERESEIAELDRAIGDGDHVYNLLRGMEALIGVRTEIENADLASSLRLSASKVLCAIGGSSGPLLSSFLTGMANAGPGHGVAGIADMYAAGVEALGNRGKTGIGCKTMMDVLVPVARRLQEMAADEVSPALILLALAGDAETGMLATRGMLATKGRASYLGERSRGHIDPGARSVQIMITAVCGYLMARLNLEGTQP
jgi:dihydroxyacetone kinase-like protein